ncbi:type II secretion system protein GspM [Rubellimicrobium aerolatum]|uniref:Type II secretion system protein GspM n=1 Tax=Rubellimicrobium aerolatum TaxID=490979 RepID=A0ABW0SCJ2_9RHOB|nr:type II secretion system protein GspM [Rubellimicrobium aerolatum]MBP1806171.1 hypothetical protein [Rubellimicrobium aerolatum]
MKGLALLLALVALAGGIVAGLTAPGQDRIEATVVRIEALRAEAEAIAARIRELDRATAGDAPGPEIARPAATAADAALALQQGVVDLARQNGLEPSTFGGQPPPEDLTLPAVGVVIEGEGELADLARFLAALESAQPPIAVSQLTLRDEARRRAEGGLAPVAFRLAAWGFWTEGGG